jgi:site-specific DNA-methyltransferase (adenine-specific)
MSSQIINDDCYNALKNIDNNSINLILTDPPYNISRESNFTKNSTNTKFNKISIDFGDWDKEELDLDSLFSEFKRVLKPGGTVVIFYDVWKSERLKQVAENYGFRQPRICQWVKNNPTPINSKINYLSNAIEFFFTFVKGKNPTFNSKYDKGIYNYPLCHGKERTSHPTQKPLELFKEIIIKHSNPGDLVLDTFAGTGTTALACVQTDRDYLVIERDQEYLKIIESRLCEKKV